MNIIKREKEAKRLCGIAVKIAKLDDPKRRFPTNWEDQPTYIRDIFRAMAKEVLKNRRK